MSYCSKFLWQEMSCKRGSQKRQDEERERERETDPEVKRGFKMIPCTSLDKT